MSDDTQVAAQPANPDGQPTRVGKVMTLREPVAFGKFSVTELKFPPVLRGKHVRRFTTDASGTMPGDVLLKVAADACGVPDVVMDGLVDRDACEALIHTMGLLALGGFVATTSGTS